MLEPWQLRLYRRSIKKKETVRAVLRHLPPLDGKRCLEIGCATGTSSWMLRQRGGRWVSTDFEVGQAESAHDLLEDDVILIDARGLPFPDHTFDVLVGINFLENLHDDIGFVREMVRVLKPGGHFLLTCPDRKTKRLGFQLKRLYGLTAESGGYGHVRDGYSRSELENIIRAAGLELEHIGSYSRFFTEVVETSLNYVYHRSAGKRNNDRQAQSFHGSTSPSTGRDFAAVDNEFRTYSAFYPVLRGFSLLDRLIPFTEGYMYCLRARKPEVCG